MYRDNVAICPLVCGAQVKDFFIAESNKVSVRVEETLFSWAVRCPSAYADYVASTVCTAPDRDRPPRWVIITQWRTKDAAAIVGTLEDEGEFRLLVVLICPHEPIHLDRLLRGLAHLMEKVVILYTGQCSPRRSCIVNTHAHIFSLLAFPHSFSQKRAGPAPDPEISDPNPTPATAAAVSPAATSASFNAATPAADAPPTAPTLAPSAPWTIAAEWSNARVAFTLDCNKTDTVGALRAEIARRVGVAGEYLRLRSVAPRGRTAVHVWCAYVEPDRTSSE